MIKTELKVITTFALIGALAGCSTIASGTPTHAPAAHSAASISLPDSVSQAIDDADGLAPCAQEDSTDCFWDASAHNGQGTSFIDWKGTTYYAK